MVAESEGLVGAAMDKEVGYTAVDLDARFASIRTSETNIGNFVCDSMRESTKADVAILNSGTLRADTVIPKGQLKMRDLVQLLPMLDELCVLEMTADELVEALENGVSQYPRLEGRFPQVSGVSFEFDADKEAGKRIDLQTVKVAGAAVQEDKERRYKVVTKDYLRAGKDGYDVFKRVPCILDGEVAGILPTTIRERLARLELLAGADASHTSETTLKAAGSLARTTSILRRSTEEGGTVIYQIKPEVEGRIVCKNPKL